MIPRFSAEVHHEVEMVIVIGKQGKNVGKKEAYDVVEGFAVGLDMTLRDIQSEAKRKGLPWAIAKGFDTSAPISDAVDRAQIPNPHNLTLSLTVNGERKQQANTGMMMYKTDFLVSYLSSLFTLEPGDLIYTGTPEGVGSVRAGDTLKASLDAVGTLQVGVINEPTGKTWQELLQ
jgi:5-carboxymethyl-2-hydroxymuconate isomerase